MSFGGESLSFSAMPEQMTVTSSWFSNPSTNGNFVLPSCIKIGSLSMISLLSFIGTTNTGNNDGTLRVPKK